MSSANFATPTLTRLKEAQLRFQKKLFTFVVNFVTKEDLPTWV
jgi:hypothetical protein